MDRSTQRIHRRRALSASASLLAGALWLSGCGSSGAGGCDKDTDCKGDRICDPETRTCVSTPGAVAEPLPPHRTAGSPIPAGGVLAADGLPVEIPPPGSTAPTLAEWGAVQREVTVTGSSAKGCETKMVREWLRVNCKPKPNLVPLEVKTKTQSGQQAYVFSTAGSVASLVVQVVRGKEYEALFTFADDKAGAGRHSMVLAVSWPPGAPRPKMLFKP